MRREHLQNIYIKILEEKGFDCAIDLDDEIEFVYHGEKYWINANEEDPGFFGLYKLFDWNFKDEAAVIKALRSVNEVNGTLKLVKMNIIDEEARGCISAGYFVARPEDFVANFELALELMQMAFCDFVKGLSDD